MNDLSLPDLGFNWDNVLEMLKTSGVEFGINIVTAIVIFYVGRLAIGLAMHGLQGFLRKMVVDQALHPYVSNHYRVYPRPCCISDSGHHRIHHVAGVTCYVVYRCTERRRPRRWSGLARLAVKFCIRCVDRIVPALQGRRLG